MVKKWDEIVDLSEFENLNLDELKEQIKELDNAFILMGNWVNKRIKDFVQLLDIQNPTKEQLELAWMLYSFIENNTRAKLNYLTELKIKKDTEISTKIDEKITENLTNNSAENIVENVVEIKENIEQKTDENIEQNKPNSL